MLQLVRKQLNQEILVRLLSSGTRWLPGCIAMSDDYNSSAVHILIHRDCTLTLYEDAKRNLQKLHKSFSSSAAAPCTHECRCPSVCLAAGSLWGRVEEQSLWSSRQLGEHSPAALLRSLVYLNTKYFGLRTVEQHLRLSFADVYGPNAVHPVTKEKSVCVRVPSISQGHHGESWRRWHQG